MSVLKVHQLVDRLRERTAAKLLHLPPTLRSGSGPGPPSASLPNTVPAAEFLSPSLDQILLSALEKTRRLTKASATETNSAMKDFCYPLYHPDGTEVSALESSGPLTQKEGLCPRMGSPVLKRLEDSNDVEPRENVIMMQHDPRDPCCCWALSAKETGPRLERRGISGCRFGRYFPLGSRFVRRVIKAYGGCPTCCLGICGGTLHDSEDQQVYGCNAAEKTVNGVKAGGFWGLPAPSLPPGGAESVFGETAASDGGLAVLGPDALADAESESGGASVFSKAHVQRPHLAGASEGREVAKDVFELQRSAQKNWKRQPRSCSRSRKASFSSGTSSRQPVLRGTRIKKSGGAGSSQPQTRLVPPLSLHDNRGFRRSAWNALEASLCELLAEAESEEWGASGSGSNKESNKEARLVRPQSAPVLTPAEARMLLVVLQSRLGYVGDLRELPVSAVKHYPYEIAGVGAALRQQLLKPRMGAFPVPISVPPFPSLQRLRMQQVALEMSLQQEKRVHVYPFSANAASSSDKLVVDGWGWLPLFLALQVSPFVLTGATVQSICVRQQCRPQYFACDSAAAPAASVEGRREASLANCLASTSKQTDGDSVSHDEREMKHEAVFEDTHPVRLCVEVNRRLKHCASHGLPQAEEQHDTPTHVW